MTIANSINNRNLTVKSGQQVVQDLTGTLDLDYNGFVLDDHGEGVVSVKLKDRVVSTGVQRNLDSAFVIDNDRDAICTYSFSLQASISVGGAEIARVNGQIREDSNNSFITVAQEQAGFGGVVVVGVEITNLSRQSMTFFVPKGYEVNLQTSGDGNVYYETGQEVLL